MHEFTAAPRIYHVHPLAMGPLDRWGAGFDHAAGMGFDTVLAAPPFDPGPVGNPFLVDDPDRLHPALGHVGAVDGLGRLAAEARARGLSLMLDLVVDRAAAGGRLAGGDAPAPDALALDPRLDPTERGAAPLPAGPDRAAALAGRLAALAEAGVAGFRCLGIERVPAPEWAELIAAVRARAPQALFLAWTPDASVEARAALEGAGFDAVFVSIARWDGRDADIVDLAEAQRTVGPAIGCPEEPFGDRVARFADGGEEARRAAGRMLWLAAALGDGLMVPMGFEFGARERMPAAGPVADLEALRGRADFDLSPEIAEANAFLARHGGDFAGAAMRALTGAGAPVTALIRSLPHGSGEGRARLVLANPDLRFGASLDGGAILERTGGVARFTDIAGTHSLSGAAVLRLGPAEVRVMEGESEGPILGQAAAMSLDEAVTAPRFAIEMVTPSVDGGRHPVKRTVGDVVTVEADLVGDGHDRLAAALLYRADDAERWREARMRPLGNDRWAAEMPLERLGRHVYTVEAWKDVFETFRDELTKKNAAGLRVTLELEEGRRLVADTLEKGAGGEGARDRLRQLLARLADADDEARLSILLDPDTAEAMREADPRRFRHRLDPPIPVDAERVAASFASWYELFPRSMSGDPKRHGTFDDVIRELPRVRAMGFDVLYFPPIHPIGRTARKGRNNSLKAGPDDPGSPYAIGSPEGGHDAVHPELGTLEDFRRLVAAAADHGLEIALDFAIQCSPDHPWLKEHPDWFDWRPDGSIRTAENPPKKYEDIVNVDFYAEGAIPSLWIALRDVVEFWIEQGVLLFRVDNPHTKTFPFWQWLIADVRGRHPGAVFLAEAFTRPKVMYRLAKIGFSQSYTYFTWRNTKQELTSYLEELTREAPRDFFRPHFFVNTPDINPAFLQNAPRSAYLIRAALAATLSGLWGVYNGFEICEGRPVPGKEEYLDSEKYEIRAWDWSRPGNIVAEITRLNRIRRDNPALWTHLGVGFLPAWNDRVIWYRKATDARDSVVLVAVSLDPHEAQEAVVELPLWEFGLSDRGRLDLTDLMRGTRFSLSGKHQRIRLDPHDLPFAIWRVDAAKEG